MYSMHKFRILALSILLLGGISIQEMVKAQPGVSISFQTFYNELSPYGRWINTPQYGSVWTPYADRDFQPYSTNGYWEVTEYGNTWVSDYDWGWAPFHYGRWSYDDYNGWFWIPGYEWGPAWVNWRSGGGYYGWAPLGPGVNINVSINIPSFWWVFLPQQYISTRNWHSYCAPRGRYNHIYNRTTIINNYYRNDNRTYVYGPRRDEIERVTRRSVVVRDIDRNRRGAVVIDHSSGREHAYDAPGSGRNGYDRRTPVENNSRNRTYDYRSNERPSVDRNNRVPDVRSDRDDRSTQPYRSNERTAPDRWNSSPDRGSQDFNRSRNQEVPGNNDNRRNRSYEQARPTPSPEQNRSRSSEPSYDRGRSRDNGNQGQERSNNGPSIRSNSSERNAGESRGGGRSYENAGGGERSERGGRSPR